MTNATQPLPDISGKIPDFVSGANEYNALLVSDYPLKKISPFCSLVITFSITVLIIIISIFCVIKFL